MVYLVYGIPAAKCCTPDILTTVKQRIDISPNSNLIKNNSTEYNNDTKYFIKPEYR